MAAIPRIVAATRRDHERPDARRSASRPASTAHQPATARHVGTRFLAAGGSKSAGDREKAAVSVPSGAGRGVSHGGGTGGRTRSREAVAGRSVAASGGPGGRTGGRKSPREGDVPTPRAGIFRSEAGFAASSRGSPEQGCLPAGARYRPSDHPVDGQGAQQQGLGAARRRRFEVHLRSGELQHATDQEGEGDERPDPIVGVDASPEGGQCLAVG